MIALRLAITELRRISAGTLPKLAVLALIVIPTLYAGLYVFANKDPYGSLDRVPAALVVEDQGATLTDPVTGSSEEVNYGHRIAERLVDGDGGFGWVETSAKEADEGVRSGRYDAALYVGSDFSEDLTSVARYEPHRASLRLVTNDANNYMATTLAKTVVGDVRNEIAREVGVTSASTFIRGLDEVHVDLQKGLKGARKLVAGTKRLGKGTDRLVSGTGRLASGAARTARGANRLASGASQGARGSAQLASGATQLAGGLRTLRQRTSALPADTQRLAAGAREVAAGNAKVAAIGRDAAGAARAIARQLAVARGDVTAIVRQLVRQGRLTPAEAARLTRVLDVARAGVDDAVRTAEGAAGKLGRLSSGAKQVAAGAGRLAGAAPALARGVATAAAGGDRVASGSTRLAAGSRTLASGASTLSSGTGQVSAGANRLAKSSTTLRQGAQRLGSGTTRLKDGLRRGLKKVPDLDQATGRDTARTIADPVALDDDTLAQAGSYGAGLAPFFMSLGLWIGAYVLFLLVRPLSARALAANGPPLRTALGGLLPPVTVGIFQVAVMLLVVRFGLRIVPDELLGTIALLLVASIAFVAIIQALNAWFGTVGEFAGLVLMLVQLVTAGGTFPWETIPEPLRSLHWLLPMTYAVNGLRQTLYGGEDSLLARDLAVLAGVGLVAMAATAWAAHRQRVWTPERLQPELVL
ncbi:YhgE/Pip domain-containing protein [Nocardioides sp. zg-1228]|uniref:YhgE/Pip domain-containing protein n=1 Tax=Nocardioides sp. zg-1228 TaxID=2763008 RepID=UPI0016427DB0|nr:YhgE/Pip domain-containing protein [Nocardioides sp. zg-1228]MBC2933083.1 YhgE/Pip domain-containing protein [Nocardioides sp. zg-1228]QSF56727.1 YhgE/Pip domain-containing protein [Nocardioides sp. zg-1228]